MVLSGALALTMATLSRTGSMTRTMLVAVTAVTLAFPFWNHRPLLFGLLALAVAIWVFERRKNPLWLIPLAWLWVNTHGSFPLIFIWFGARLTGMALDARSVGGLPWKYPAAMAAGVMVAGANPFGFELLTFPFRTLAAKGDIFAAIVEWRAPNFHSFSGLVLLVPLLVVVAVVARHRLQWGSVLPLLAFLALGLYSQRNLPALAVVMAPILATLLKVERDDQPKGEPSSVIVFAAISAVALAVAAAGVKVAVAEPLALDTYPVEALAYVDANGLADKRMVMPEYVGCYRIFEKGRAANVFIDDRYDMYPQAVSNDYLALANGNGVSPAEVLPRYGIEVVIWDRQRPLHHWLVSNPGWTERWADHKWSVFVKNA